MKKSVSFSPIMYVYLLPPEDRFNQEFYNTLRFKERIKKTEKLLKSIFENLLIKSE